ncbi:MAG: hypothetical protein OEQ39_21970 [Gammaproteobacteria bacterium]|nr:hypothetical protein [Gammaproteobacteria bacterium]
MCKIPSRSLALSIIVLLMALATGCASTRAVPFTIQSDPLGAYVLLQIKSSQIGDSSDWIFVGNTPLSTTRTLSDRQLRSAESVTIRVMKEGYFDQSKQWNPNSLLVEKKEKGMVFWNPRLVRSSE